MISVSKQQFPNTYNTKSHVMDTEVKPGYAEIASCLETQSATPRQSIQTLKSMHELAPSIIM